MKREKGCRVIGTSIDGQGRLWFIMDDNWIVPAWKRYIITNQRTGKNHCLLDIKMSPQGYNTHIEVDDGAEVQLGDIMTVMLGIPHTESDTRGCQCDDCERKRSKKLHPEDQHLKPELSDEEISEIFQVVAPRKGKPTITKQNLTSWALKVFFPGADPNTIDMYGVSLVTPANVTEFNKLYYNMAEEFEIISEEPLNPFAELEHNFWYGNAKQHCAEPLESHKMIFIDDTEYKQGTAERPGN